MMPIYELIARRGPLHRYDMANLMELSQSLAKVPKIDSPSLKRWLQDL
jgi:pantothenate kinase